MQCFQTSATVFQDTFLSPKELLVLKIISLSSNAVVKSGDKVVHHGSPFISWNHSNFMLQCVDHLLNVQKKFTTDTFLEAGKDPVIWGIEVRAVRRVWHLGQTYLLKPLLHN